MVPGSLGANGELSEKIDVSWPNLDSISSNGDPYAIWLQEIQEKWDKAGRPTVARARTVVWRLGDGDYFPTTSECGSLVHVDPFEPHANKEFSLGPSKIVQCPHDPMVQKPLGNALYFGSQICKGPGMG